MRVLTALLAIGLIALLAWITLVDPASEEPDVDGPGREKPKERAEAAPDVVPNAGPSPAFGPTRPETPAGDGAVAAAPTEKPRAVVRGRVLNADGNGVAGAFVQPAGPFVPTKEQPRPTMSETEADGSFAISLPPVAQVLTAVGAGVRPPKEGVAVTPPAKGVVLRVQRTPVALIRVVAEDDGRPVAGATVRLKLPPGGWLQAVTSGLGFLAFAYSGPEDPDGRHSILVTAPGFRDAELTDLAYRDLVPSAKLIVKLVRDLEVEPGRLEGRVLYDTGDPFHGSLTLSFSSEGKAGEVHRIETNEKGEFVIPKVAAGEYVLRSAPHGESILRETGKTLVIPPGGRETTEFVLTRGGDVDLTVAGPDGAMVKDVTVVVLDDDGGEARRFVLPGGSAKIPDLAPGPVRIRVEKSGYSKVETEVTIVKDQVTETTVRLEESR